MASRAFIQSELRPVIYEAARKFHESARRMVNAETQIERNAKFQETMRTLAWMSEQLYEWRVKVESASENSKMVGIDG